MSGNLKKEKFKGKFFSPNTKKINQTIIFLRKILHRFRNLKCQRYYKTSRSGTRYGENLKP